MGASSVEDIPPLTPVALGKTLWNSTTMGDISIQIMLVNLNERTEK